MIGKRILHSVFPRPRTPVTFWSAFPLIIFLAIYAFACLFLEWSNRLFFERPGAFVLMVAAVWIWWMHVAGFSGLSQGRALAALLTRLVLVGGFVMLMAEPRAVRTRDVLSVVYTVDISDSIGEGSTDAALKFVAESVSQKPEGDEAGLVVFGRNSAVELPPRISFPFEGESITINSRIDRDATNLEQSLSLAAAMVPEENRGRIVLISDGTQTEGSLSQVLDQLKSRQIAVDVLPIQYKYNEEVWLERLELPRMVKLGENYESSVVLSSLQAGSGRLILRENGKIISEQEIEYQAGKNRYTIPLYLREPGYYEYSATLEVPRDRDHLTENNSVMNYLFIEGEGKVLLVTDPKGDERDWQSLIEAIREGQRMIEVQQSYNFPRNSLSLMPYDCIIFANVGADAFDVVQLEAARDAVYNLGVGFMMVGGANSFGPGGYHRTVIEEALPVSMDVTKKKVLPKGALAIILHTCEFPEGNTWGKRITKQAIKVLSSQDEVGVLAYGSGGEGWVFELTPAGQYDELAKKINAAQIGDMPSFANTMKLGLDGLLKSDAATRHMIIISDGDPSPPPPSLISQFIKNQVSVSMVAVFPHGGQDISKMRSIAAVTGGKYYFPADPSQLPSIFIKEAKTLKRSMIQNETIAPRVGFPSAVLKGIDALPLLHGYVLTTAKSRAETVLLTPPQESEVGETDPVLAIWKYGLGTTAAFTSDFSPNWGADWMQWEQFQAFINQLMIRISRVEKSGHLRMWNNTSGNEGNIIVEDFHPQDSFLEVQATVAGPRDRRKTVTLKQVGPRRYQATVPLWGKGRYQVLAVGIAGDREDRSHGGFIVPYSPEYLRFRSNPVVLNEIANQTGGQVLDDATPPDVIYGRRQPKSSSWPVFDWFLISLACLIPLDVAIRRIQLDWNVIKGWIGLGATRSISTQTMGALLERKQTVSSQMVRRDGERPLDPVRSSPRQRARPTSAARHPAPQPVAPAVGKTGSSSKSSQKADDLENLSTTERLLALKRRRQDDNS